MSEAKPVTINADIMWASLNEPNRMSGKYQIDLTQLSAPAMEALEMMGLGVRNKAGQETLLHASLATLSVRMTQTVTRSKVS